MHLPLFAGEASGLFAEHGLDVDLVGPLGRGPENVVRTAEGGADFALTSVYYYLAARQQLGGRLRARFVAVVHQRSPLAAFVPLESPLEHPADLGGVRVAGATPAWFQSEYQGRLVELGLQPAVVVPVGDGDRPSLARGEVDVIFSWAEAMPLIRQSAGIPVRSIPFGADIYATGLVAADDVAPGVVSRMVQALRAALEQQRRQPSLGIAELCARLPSVGPDRVREEWVMLNNQVLVGDECLTMHSQRWVATIEHVCRTHGFDILPVVDVVRADMLQTPASVLSDR